MDKFGYDDTILLNKDVFFSPVSLTALFTKYKNFSFTFGSLTSAPNHNCIQAVSGKGTGTFNIKNTDNFVESGCTVRTQTCALLGMGVEEC